MLSDEEKREMLEDVKSESRRKAFAACGNRGKVARSYDEYISFLEDIQKIFKPFPLSNHITPTHKNKL